MLLNATGLLEVCQYKIPRLTFVCIVQTYVTITTMKFQILKADQYSVHAYQQKFGKSYQLPVVEIALAGARILRGVISAIDGQSSVLSIRQRHRTVRRTWIQPCHSQPTDCEERVEDEQKDRSKNAQAFATIISL